MHPAGILQGMASMNAYRVVLQQKVRRLFATTTCVSKVVVVMSHTKGCIIVNASCECVLSLVRDRGLRQGIQSTQLRRQHQGDNMNWQLCRPLWTSVLGNSHAGPSSAERFLGGTDLRYASAGAGSFSLAS